MLDIQNKCPFGLCRGWYRIFAVSEMEHFVTKLSAQLLSIEQRTPSQM